MRAGCVLAAVALATSGIFAREVEVHADACGVAADETAIGALVAVHDRIEALWAADTGTDDCSKIWSRQGKSDMWWYSRMKAKRTAIKESGGTFDVVWLGDSITHNFEKKKYFCYNTPKT